MKKTTILIAAGLIAALNMQAVFADQYEIIALESVDTTLLIDERAPLITTIHNEYEFPMLSIDEKTAALAAVYQSGGAGLSTDDTANPGVLAPLPAYSQIPLKGSTLVFEVGWRSCQV